MKKKSWKKWLFRLVYLLVAAAILWAGWFFGVKPLIAKIKGDVITPQDIEPVKKDKIELFFKTSGTITAKQDEKVTAKPSGILKAVYVKEGDFVKEGQEVGLIKPGRNEFEDYKPMPILSTATGTVVKCHADSMDYDKDISERDLSLPRLGTFLNGSYDNADNATCFLRVVNMDTLVIPMYVTERQVLKLSNNMPVDIKIPALGDKAPPLKGKITHISSQIEKSGSRWSDSKGFLVLVELPRNKQNILLGVNANVSIVLEKKEDVLVIPAVSLFEKQGKSYVFKYLGNNKTKKVEIETGLANDTLVEVTKGLQEGEKILNTLPYGESW